MDFCSVQNSEIKISARPSAENETIPALVPDFVKKLKSLDFFGCLVQLSYSALEDLCLMDLSVVAAHFLLGVVIWQRFCFRMTGYASGIHAMGLRKSCSYPFVLGQVSISQ